jgi:hypothetical protein
MVLKYPKQYRFMALDCQQDEAFDVTYNSIEKLVAAQGERFKITRRQCESIRKKTPLANKKYKHICIIESYRPGVVPPTAASKA